LAGLINALVIITAAGSIFCQTRLAGHRCVIAFSEQTPFAGRAYFFVVFASYISIATVNCAIVIIVTVFSCEHAGSVHTAVQCACVKVIANNRLFSTLTVLANLRRAKVGGWAGLVVALVFVAQVEGASVVVVAILVGIVETAREVSAWVAFNDPTSIVGSVTETLFDARVRLSIFNAWVHKFALVGRSARLGSVGTAWISRSVKQANSVLAFSLLTETSESASSGSRVTSGVGASVSCDTFVSVVAASWVGSVGVCS
jgi:hypothetical protein